MTKNNIRELAKGYGGCFATDRIMVDGMRVGYMYREQPDNRIDSGWRFMCGDESDEYMNNSDNMGIYDVNTVANYDLDIIKYLTSPIGSCFSRFNESKQLLPDNRGKNTTDKHIFKYFIDTKITQQYDDLG